MLFLTNVMRVTSATRLVLAVLHGMVLAGCESGCASRGPRFVDNANGTITDKLTGLQWEKQIELDRRGSVDNPHDVDNYYRWAGRCTVTRKYCQPTAAAAALCAATAEDGTTGCDQCTGEGRTCDAATTVWTAAAERNAARFAGQADWRVPTREELVSIVDYRATTYPMTDVAFHAAGCGPACRDVSDPACSCTRKNSYWSASSLARNPAGVWVVAFTLGDVTFFNKSAHQFSVRLVRGGSWLDRFPHGWGSRVGLSAPTLPPGARPERTIPDWTPSGGHQLMEVRCCLGERQCEKRTAAECTSAGGLVRGTGSCSGRACINFPPPDIR